MYEDVATVVDLYRHTVNALKVFLNTRLVDGGVIKFRRSGPAVESAYHQDQCPSIAGELNPQDARTRCDAWHLIVLSQRRARGSFWFLISNVL